MKILVAATEAADEAAMQVAKEAANLVVKETIEIKEPHLVRRSFLIRKTSSNPVTNAVVKTVILRALLAEAALVAGARLVAISQQDVALNATDLQPAALQ